MAENESTTPEAAGTSRRALLGKAAAAGAVVYAVPMIKSIPAYAAGGLASYNYQSDPVCIWFSPAQNKWHADITAGAGGVVATAVSPTAGAPMTVGIDVNGTTRNVRFTGSPVNQTGVLGLGNDNSGSYYYGGGGSFIESLDTNCEIQIVGVGLGIFEDKLDKAAKCAAPDLTVAPSSWAVGSSDSSITGGAIAPNENVGSGVFQTAYYHSGLQGPQGKKCHVGFKLRVRCK